jgi:hypothetical protein
MAKSDLLKEAIADAKAVKETALANAKIALQEAFAPRLEAMLQTKLQNEVEGEEDMDVAGDDAAMNMDAADAAETGMGDMPSNVKVGLDFDDDGEWDLEGMVGAGEEMPAEEQPAEEQPASDEEMTAEYNEGHGPDDLDVESIIRELEGDLDMEVEDDMIATEGMYSETDEDPTDMYSEAYEEGDETIEEIIEAILREEEDSMMGPDSENVSEEEDVVDMLQTEIEEKDQELQEAYRTVKHLQAVINEVNLLNAKLLYTNKLFRNFELSETQKMKVIENFDRAANTREAKLVFATLAESFNKPTKKRVVKESYASRPTRTTAPSPETTQILSEGFEMANRWKKLAGLL